MLHHLKSENFVSVSNRAMKIRAGNT